MKRIASIAGIVVALSLGIAIALPSLFNANQFRGALENRLTAALGRKVTLGELKIAVFSGGVSASDLSIADDPAFGAKPFLQAQSVHVGVEMLPLIFSRKLNVTTIAIDQPQIDLIESPTGAFNVSGIGAQSGPGAPAPGTSTQPNLSIALLRISDGHISLEKAGASQKPLILDKLNIEVRNFAANSQFPFSLTAGLSGGGSIQMNGTGGPIDAGDMLETPFNAKLSLVHFDLAGSGLVDPATGIAGIASVDGSVESAGGSIDVAGKLKAEQMKLVRGGTPARRPVEVDLEVVYNLATQSGELRQVAIHLGKAVAKVTGTCNLKTEPATVNLKVSGSRMPLSELATFLPALNVTLPAGASLDQGTLDLNLSSQGPVAGLVTQGTVSGQNVRLANFDFASKLQVLRELSGIKGQPHTLIKTLTSNVRNTAQGTALDHMQVAVSSVGLISGAGTISPSHALDFRMHAGLGGGTVASITDVPFTIEGTTENPSIKPDVKSLASEKFKALTGGKSPAAAGGLVKGLFGGRKKQ